MQKGLNGIYKGSLTLLTDLYQLSMAYGYWKSGKAEREAVFNVFYRKNPFHGGYAVMCGLEYVLDFIENFGFSEDDIHYLSTITTRNGKPMFENEFLEYLSAMTFTCDVDAMEEGTVLFPHEPMVRVRGPVIQAQLIETPLLNIINFQTLVATKASRVNLAAKGEPVLEFGLRRAQGVDGGLAASRASYIGGCNSTSNILAGKLFGIPVSGTHAHSWIMSFDNELEAFNAYADAMPDNCIFLVDTYDTLRGVENAIIVGKRLRKEGKELLGIRIDSGDLAYLSIEARKMLDEAGFSDTVIVASNDLDEHIIRSLKTEQDAAINVWGVGTKLVTAFDQPALGAVYKMSAIQDPEGNWQNKVKLSEQAIKVNNPGIQQVRRFFDGEQAVSDMIYDIRNVPDGNAVIVDPMDPTRKKKIKPKQLGFKDLLEPMFRKGELVYDKPEIDTIRKELKTQLARFHSGVKRFTNPHKYPVGLEQALFDEKTALILKLRETENGNT